VINEGMSMTNQEVYKAVFEDMVQSKEWWCVGQLVEKHNLTISQRDYLRQVLYSERTGFTSSHKKVDRISFYKLRKNGAQSEINKVLRFKPTSCSVLTER